MRFWDASAVIPLLIDEPMSRALWTLAANDPAHAVWWGTAIECVSALASRRRTNSLPDEGFDQALSRLQLSRAGWIEVPPSDDLRSEAERLLRVHPLRAGDALQLAAAMTAASNNPSPLGFVCLDERLGAAARQEGFDVLP